MIRFIHQPQANKVRHLRAFGASCVFHGLLLGLLLGLTLLYRSGIPPKSGSIPGTPSIMLSTLVIVSPPAKPTTIPSPVPPARSSSVTTTPMPPEPEELKSPHPEQGLPVLAIQSSSAPAAASEKINPPTHPVISHVTVATLHSKAIPPKATAFASSYAPGPSEWPHPPYPSEAHDRGETGTVIMNVQFDAQGAVARVEVAQSSGVAVLDASTRSFIRAHWHSPAYAGQTVSVPVEYKLENL